MKRHHRIGSALLALILILACAPLLPSVASIPTDAPGAISTYIVQTRNAAGTQTQLFTTPTRTSTPTRTPSRTPTITPTPTGTIIFKFPTFTKSVPGSGGNGNGGGGGGSGNGNGNGNGGGGGGGGQDEPPGGVVVIGMDIYYCEVISVTPANRNTYVGGDIIGNGKISWVVKNIGNVNWDPTGLPNDPEHPNVDFVWMSGSKLSTYTIYDTPLVRPGETVTLTIGIPNKNGAPAKPAIAPKKAGTYSIHWALRIGTEEFCRDMEFIFYVIAPTKTPTRTPALPSLPLP